MIQKIKLFPYFSATIYLLVFTILIGCQNKDQQKAIEKNEHYLDPYRPQVHYSRDTGWLSDPNGLFYFDGKYHLMYQGFSNRRGAYDGTNWDHAVSEDLLHWKHLPTVLDGKNQVSYYSGCSVVDIKNTSGLGKDGKTPIVAFYTTHFMGKHPIKPNSNKISIAFSLDNGETWEYGDRHVIENPEFPAERDPSVIWHEESKKWIMATAGTGHIRFYSSKNLLDWIFESKALPYPSWECPDMSFIKVKETGEEMFVLITSTNGGVPNSTHGTCYHIGKFDGTNFIPSDTTDTKHWLDWGTDFYAGISYSNTPDNRPLFQSWFGWPSQWNSQLAPTTKFSGSMNLIRELSLFQTDKGYRLKSFPIPEYKELRQGKKKIKIPVKTLTDEKELFDIEETHQAYEIAITASLDDGEALGLRLRNDFGEDYIFKYDNWHKQFISDRTRTSVLVNHYSKSYSQKAQLPYHLNEGKLKLKIYWDVSTIEVFIDGGKESFSTLLYPREPFNKIYLFSENGEVELSALDVHELKSIW